MIASTILDLAQNQLSFSRSDIGIPGLEETQLLAVLNQAVIEYYHAFRKGGGEPPINFQKETGFDLTADTDTDAIVTTSTTSFAVADSSNFPTSGVLAIWEDEYPDYVAFTGNAANTFTGVSGIGKTIPAGSTVSRLYALPSDFSDLRSMRNTPYGVAVEGVPYTPTSDVPTGNRFHIYDNGTTKYLHFPRGLVGDCFVRYNAKPTTIDDVSDTVDLPEKDEWFAVWRIVQHAAPLLNKIENYKIAQAEAQKVLSNAMILRNEGKRIRVRPMHRPFSRSLISGNPDYR